MSEENRINARLQVRRGNQIELPQPLREGEVGLAKDTQKVYIGLGDDNVVNAAFITEGEYTPAKSLIENEMLWVEYDTLSAFDYAALITMITTDYPTITESMIERSATDGIVVVGLTTAIANDAPTLNALQADIDAEVGVTNVSLGAVVTFDDTTFSYFGANTRLTGIVSLVVNELSGNFVSNVASNLELASVNDLRAFGEVSPFLSPTIFAYGEATILQNVTASFVPMTDTILKNVTSGDGVTFTLPNALETSGDVYRMFGVACLENLSTTDTADITVDIFQQSSGNNGPIASTPVTVPPESRVAVPVQAYYKTPLVAPTNNRFGVFITSNGPSFTPVDILSDSTFSVQREVAGNQTYTAVPKMLVEGEAVPFNSPGGAVNFTPNFELNGLIDSGTFFRFNNHLEDEVFLISGVLNIENNNASTLETQVEVREAANVITAVRVTAEPNQEVAVPIHTYYQVGSSPPANLDFSIVMLSTGLGNFDLTAGNVAVSRVVSSIEWNA